MSRGSMGRTNGTQAGYEVPKSDPSLYIINFVSGDASDDNLTRLRHALRLARSGRLRDLDHLPRGRDRTRLRASVRPINVDRFDRGLSDPEGQRQFDLR